MSSGVKLTACHRADYVTKLGLAEYLTKLGLNDMDAGQVEHGKGVTFWGLTRRWIANGCDVQDADAALVREFIEAMRGKVVVAWPRTSEYTRKRVEALRPEALPAVRETFALHSEEYDAIRDRTLDGVDGRVAVLRAAEAAQPGQVQEAVEATVCELLKRGRARHRASPVGGHTDRQQSDASWRGAAGHGPSPCQRPRATCRWSLQTAEI